MEDKINPKEHIKNNPKRRVLFVITQAEFGGAQKFLSQLLNNLEPEKFECAIVTGPEKNKEIKNLLPLGVKYIPSRHLQRNPGFFSDIASLFELKKIIKEFRPDTLFLNSSKAGFIGSLAAKLSTVNCQLSTIYRIGGWAFNDPRSWWKNILYRLLEKISASWKDYIIVNNRHDYEQAIKYGIKPRKEVILVYNGIDPYKLEFFDKDEAKIRLYELLPLSQKHAGFLHGGLIIGTIANFYKTKGLEYLIEAFKILANTLNLIPYTLVIIGDGPERENLQLQIANKQLQNTIFLAGRIPDAYKYLRAFDIFVLPSVKEGFPWALLEATSAKIPVIATAVGAVPEILEHEKNGLLIPPHDSQALANAITHLAENESLRREFAIQAHQTVLHNFDLRKMVEQIKKLL
ncbi:MAG: glycosyltransferase family 4 protein [Candidatus Yanofskybacteria bacterium]|nr:glycosyltransferase family 4 protein [Candidatus Yanofskybacteria bacterium]